MKKIVVEKNMNTKFFLFPDSSNKILCSFFRNQDTGGGPCLIQFLNLTLVRLAHTSRDLRENTETEERQPLRTTSFLFLEMNAELLLNAKISASGFQ